MQVSLFTAFNVFLKFLLYLEYGVLQSGTDLCLKSLILCKCREGKIDLGKSVIF